MTCPLTCIPVSWSQGSAGGDVPAASGPSYITKRSQVITIHICRGVVAATNRSLPPQAALLLLNPGSVLRLQGRGAPPRSQNGLFDPFASYGHGLSWLIRA